MTIKFTSFDNAVTYAGQQFKDEVVHSSFWQGVPVASKPEMAMHEVMFYSFEVPMYGTDLQVYRDDIKPNLPWADIHFEEERVSGEPINPGESWKIWPYGHSASKFRTDKGPPISDHEWAYLAGLVDGDGAIIIKNFPDGSKKPWLTISQVEQEYLKKIQRRFGVGRLKARDDEENIMLNRKGEECYGRPRLTWQVSAADDLKWMLSGLISHLRLKRERAQEAFNLIPDADLRKVCNKGREPTFNHNYMERYWPKYANMTSGGRINSEIIKKEELIPRRGVYGEYGDLNDLVELLYQDPLTRQAYLPVWFPEDTALAATARKPCTLGYHFIRRDDKLHIVYYIRSCDFVRHFRDDVYLTARLLLWVLEKLKEKDKVHWDRVIPGNFLMHITSLHLFRNDYIMMKKDADDKR